MKRKKRNPVRPRDNIISFRRSPEPGSLAWRYERGLCTISDLVDDYRSKRRPRGPYIIPMPDDLIEVTE